MTSVYNKSRRRGLDSNNWQTKWKCEGHILNYCWCCHSNDDETDQMSWSRNRCWFKHDCWRSRFIKYEGKMFVRMKKWNVKLSQMMLSGTCLPLHLFARSKHLFTKYKPKWQRECNLSWYTLTPPQQLNEAAPFSTPTQHPYTHIHTHSNTISTMLSHHLELCPKRQCRMDRPEAFYIPH